MAKITDRFLRGLKATASKQEFLDEGCDNLVVTVQPQGKRDKAPTIAFVYRASISGRRFKKTLGRYPGMTLSEAHDEAIDLNRARDRGEIDVFFPPVEEEKAAPLTVREAWALYMREDGSKKKTAGEKQAVFDRELVALRDRPLLEVTRREIGAIIAAKHAVSPSAALKLLAFTKRLFRWCAREGEFMTGLAVDPARDIAPMSKPQARDRALDADELRWLMKSLPQAKAQLQRHPDPVTDEYPVIYELLLRTVLRSDDIFDLRAGEVVLDEDGQPEKIHLFDSKGGRRFAVWLHPRAAQLLAGRLEGKGPQDRVFRAKKAERPLNRVRAKMVSLAQADGRTVEHWTIHDFRQTANDALAGMLDANDQPLFSGFIRDRVLNHVDPSVRGRHYESHEYYAEKKAAIRAWNEHLNRIERGKLLRLVAA